MDYMPQLLALKTALSTPERPAVLNRQEVNPPCVFIALRGFDTWTVCGSTAEASVHLWLIIGDRNDENALLALSPLLSDLLEQLDELGLPVEAIAADQVRVTDTDLPYPSFRIETHLTV